MIKSQSASLLFTHGCHYSHLSTGFLKVTHITHRDSLLR